MTDHPPLEVLADATEGLLDPDRAAEVEAHLAGCASCRDEVAALRGVSVTLAAVPAPAMPATVADWLAGVLADEQRRRVRLGALHVVEASPLPAVPEHPYGTAAKPRPGLGRFGADLHKVSAGRRWGLPILAAAVAAGIVGFGAYVGSAWLGLNDPPTVAVSVSQGQLGAQAGNLYATQDLTPHRFSQAWWCAKRAQPRTIVALASTTDAGRPALLVYVSTPTGLGVTVVTGCDTGSPSARAWEPVTR